MTDTSLHALDHFSRLIHPFDPDAFVDSTYEQRPLYIHRDDGDYFANVLAMDEIERLFHSAALAKSFFRINKEGKEVHPDQFSERTDGLPNDRLSNDLALKLFGDGHTLIINSGNRLFPNLDRFCAELEKELRFRVQPNIYITPFSAQGFATHYDDHDVFIMQVMGSKHWRVFHSEVELASRLQAHVSGNNYALQVPQIEVTLTPGDTLYIPRGVLHDANTDGVTSAHITLGLHPTCGFDLVRELAQVAQEALAFRKALPLGLLRDRSAAAAAFKRNLMDLVADVDVEQLLERRYKSFVENRRPDARDRFSDLARMNRFNLNTVVRRRPTVLYTIERSERSLTVNFSGHKVPVQPFLESALESVLGDGPRTIRDIKGFLTDTARLDLASTLLKAGLLEVVEWNSD